MEVDLKNIERLSQNKDCIFREEDEGAFLFDPETGNLKFINSMGVNVYQLCDGSMTIGDITSMVIGSYREISSKKIEEDIKVFLKSLVEMGFLRRDTNSA